MTDFDYSHCPPQALEDRGIVELLLTSDNKDGLSKGVVHGGTCTEGVGGRVMDRGIWMEVSKTWGAGRTVAGGTCI